MAGEAPYPVTVAKLRGWLIKRTHVHDYKSSSLEQNAAKLCTVAKHHEQWNVTQEEMRSVYRNDIPRLMKQAPALTKHATVFRSHHLDRFRLALMQRIRSGDCRALQVLTIVSLSYDVGARAANWADGCGLLRDIVHFDATSTSPAGFNIAIVMDKNSTTTLNAQHNAIFNTGTPLDTYDCLCLYLPRVRRHTPQHNAVAFPKLEHDGTPTAVPYTPTELNHFFQSELEAAGLPHEGVTLHGGRAGGYTDNKAAGMSEEAARGNHRWKSNSALRYNRGTGSDKFGTSAAALRLLQQGAGATWSLARPAAPTTAATPAAPPASRYDNASCFSSTSATSTSSRVPRPLTWTIRPATPSVLAVRPASAAVARPPTASSSWTVRPASAAASWARHPTAPSSSSARAALLAPPVAPADTTVTTRPAIRLQGMATGSGPGGRSHTRLATVSPRVHSTW